MIYAVVFKHGFEYCTRPDTVADIAIHGEAIEVHSFDDVHLAYCWCCQRSVERQLEQGNRRPPVFPRLEDLQMDVAYFEPGYGPAETLPYARYFGAISGDYAGVFTAVSNIREFLAQFKKGQIREFDDEEAAKKWVQNVYYRLLYPAAAYINSGYFPTPLIYEVDCVYNLGYSKWLTQNLSGDSPFKFLNP